MKNNNQYKPKLDNIERLKIAKKIIKKNKEIDRFECVNNVVYCSTFTPSIKSLMNDGYDINDALEILDRVQIHNKNNLHKYSSQFRHDGNNPLAIEKGSTASTSKGLHRYNKTLNNQ